MPTNDNVENKSKNLNAPVSRGRFHFVRTSAAIVGGALLLCSASGCLATRNWVNDQLTPINERLSVTDAKSDVALNDIQNLQLEQKLVLDSSNGPTFAFGSANLTPNAKRAIDGFIEDLASSKAEPGAGRVFLIAGYTDSVGTEDYNYELGQRRAEKVAGYLVGKEGVDPTQVRVVSYGATKPVADNSTASGRRSNRRVEILVYQEKIAVGSSGSAAVQAHVNEVSSVE